LFALLLITACLLFIQPLTLTAPFYDQFTDDWESRWRVSHAKKADAEEEWAYVGQWSVQEPTVLKGIEGDKGLGKLNRFG
jgi:calnexin